MAKLRPAQKTNLLPQQRTQKEEKTDGRVLNISIANNTGNTKVKRSKQRSTCYLTILEVVDLRRHSWVMRFYLLVRSNGSSFL